MIRSASTSEPPGSGSAQRLGWQLAEQVAVVLCELAEMAESPIEGNFRDRALAALPAAQFVVDMKLYVMLRIS